MTDEDAARAGKFVAALVAELDAPKRRVERVSFQRWSRLGLAAFALLLAAYGVRALILGPNLAVGQTVSDQLGLGRLPV